MGGMTWRAMATGTISDHAADVYGDGFVGAGAFYLLSGRDLHVLDDRLVHEVLADGDGVVFKIFGLGEDP